MSVQIIPPSPRDMQWGQLGQALGSGIGAFRQKQQQEQQQKKLAELIFGPDGSQQYGELPMESQLQYAKLQAAQQAQLQKQAQQEQKNQLFASIFGGGGLGEQPQEDMPMGGPQADLQQPGIQTQQVPKAGIRELSDDQIAAITLVDPNLAKILQSQKESRIKKEIKASEISRKEQLEFHRESAKFDEELSKTAESSEKKLRAIASQKKILPKLNKKDRIVTALFSGTKYENLVKSQNAQEFDSRVLPMLEGMRQLFGQRLSDADLRLILQKIATAEKDPEANKAILDWQEFETKLDVDRKKIADEIRKENKGLRPIDYQNQIAQRMDQKFGKEIEEKAKNLIGLEDDPEDLVKITERKKVPPGTPLDTTAIDLYLKLSDNDPDKARELASEDGYEF